MVDQTQVYEDEIENLGQQVEKEKSDKDQMKKKLDNRIIDLEENLSRVNKLNEEYKREVIKLQETQEVMSNDLKDMNEVAKNLTKKIQRDERQISRKRR